jgi:hypothetical protein
MSCSVYRDLISVDRIDSTKGYQLDNIVMCKWQVNQMKTDMTLEEFKSIIFETNDGLRQEKTPEISFEGFDYEI